MKWFSAIACCVSLGCCDNTTVGPKIDALKLLLRSANETQTSVLKATYEELIENTAALNEIRSQIQNLNTTVSEKIPTQKNDKPESTPSVETSSGGPPANALQPSSPEGVANPTPTSDVPIYVSVISGCAPCQRLKSDHAAGMFIGFDVTYATDWFPDVYPAIRYPTKSSKTGWAVIYGYDGETTIEKLRELTKATSDDSNVSDQSENPIVGERYCLRSIPRWRSSAVRSKNFFRSSRCPTCASP